MPLRVLVPVSCSSSSGFWRSNRSGPPDPVVSPATAVVADIVLSLTPGWAKKILAAWAPGLRTVASWSTAGRGRAVTVAKGRP